MDERRLHIPQELLDWASDPAVAVRWPRPWAQHVETLLRQQPLGPEDLERLLSRLEALCREALRDGRPDLLVGFDLWTAARLGLSYTFGDSERVRVGHDGDWSYGELGVLMGTDSPPEALAFARQCKEVVAETFPGARIDAIIDADDSAGSLCHGCERAQAVLLDLDTGSSYCGECWRGFVVPVSEAARKGKRERKEKRKR